MFGDIDRRIPGNLCFGMPGLPAEQLVQAVSDEIAISTGAACATGSLEPSHVLLALGADPELAATGVRLSLGRFTNPEDIQQAAHALRCALKFAVPQRREVA